MTEQTDQMMIEVYSHAMIYGTGFLKLAMTTKGLEWSVVDPKDYRYIQPVDITGVWVDEMAEVPPEAWAKLGNKEKK